VCCVTNRTPQVDADEIFGFGVWKSGFKNFGTSAEIICASAFDGRRIVKSTQNVRISYLLPLMVNAAHWSRSKRKLFDECQKMWKDNSDFVKIKPIPCAPVVVARVICRILSCMVADEKVAGDDAGVLSAAKGETSDCFISGYFSILRLLKQLSLEHPEIVQFADSSWKTFVEVKESRLKTLYPNIGEMLPLLCITSPAIDWNYVKRAYVEESSLRNVMWYASLNSSLSTLNFHPF
jgi:hypothetical protein